MRAYSVWSAVVGAILLVTQLWPGLLGSVQPSGSIALMGLALFHAIFAIWYWQGQSSRHFALATVFGQLVLAALYIRVAWTSAALPLFWLYLIVQSLADILGALSTVWQCRQSAAQSESNANRPMRPQDRNRAWFALYMTAIGLWMLIHTAGFIAFFRLPIVLDSAAAASWGPIQLLAVQVLLLAALNGVAVRYQIDKLIDAGVRGGLFTCVFMVALVLGGMLHPVVLLLPLVDFVSVAMVFFSRRVVSAPLHGKLQITDGVFMPFAHGCSPDGLSGQVWALGMTFADHIRETGENADQPVVFAKQSHPSVSPSVLSMPTPSDISGALQQLDAPLTRALFARLGELPALLDYEVELGMMLLEDWHAHTDNTATTPSTMPSVGFFLANDATARTVQIAGLDGQDRLRYWSASKSFAGFLPVSASIWCPAQPCADAWPDVTLSTRVNGQQRQHTHMSNILYTPLQVLQWAAAQTPDGVLRRSTIVLTGTPAGVAMRASAWKRRLASLLPRQMAVAAAIRTNKQDPRFLKRGDVIEMQADWLGHLSTQVV